MSDEETKLLQVVALTEALAEINDLDLLLEKILTTARQVVHADAGSIYLIDGQSLTFSHTQNATLSKRLQPGEKLVYTTFTVPINANSIAGYVALTGTALNIADAYQLPVDVPYRFSIDYDKVAQYRTTSVLTLPLHTSRGKIVGVLQLINALDARGEVMPFTVDDERLAVYFASNSAIAVERTQMTRALILRMIAMAEMRDPKETGPHVNRVAAYAVEIYERWAQKQGVPEATVDHQRDVLRMAAMLHDVGKVAISDAILKKPGSFTPEEYAIMKQHTYLGAQLFIGSASELDEAAAQVALNHHENWDGSGYPGCVDVASGCPVSETARKQGEEIPLFGRVVAAADVYDALRSKRVYKGPMGEQEALEIINNDAGRKFDPAIVEALIAAMDSIRAIEARYPDAEA